MNFAIKITVKLSVLPLETPLLFALEFILIQDLDYWNNGEACTCCVVGSLSSLPLCDFDKCPLALVPGGPAAIRKRFRSRWHDTRCFPAL